MTTRDRAPVGYTCPDIDAMIDDIKEATEKAQELANELDCPLLAKAAEDLLGLADTLDGLYKGPGSPLEKLRDANAKLRDFGNEQAERADLAEAECKRLLIEQEDAC